MAGHLQGYREKFGVSYVSVLEPYRMTFAKVIKHLR